MNNYKTIGSVVLATVLVVGLTNLGGRAGDRHQPGESSGRRRHTG